MVRGVSVSINTCTGDVFLYAALELLVEDVAIPKLPYLFIPQAQTVPSCFRTIVWSPPAFISIISSISTFTGTFEFAVFPYPNCP